MVFGVHGICYVACLCLPAWASGLSIIAQTEQAVEPGPHMQQGLPFWWKQQTVYTSFKCKSARQHARVSSGRIWSVWRCRYAPLQLDAGCSWSILTSSVIPGSWMLPCGL